MKIKFFDITNSASYDLESSKSIVVWTDNLKNATADEYKNDVRILILYEPPSIYGITLDKVKGVAENYNYIFTYQNELLKLPNAHLLSPLKGVSWLQLYDTKTDSPVIEDPKKECKLSFICGFKEMTEGHLVRKRIWKRQKEITFSHVFYKSQHNRGLEDIDNNPIIGGTYSKDELFDTFMFHLVIENDRIPNWFTEKINDCFLSKTVPIYYGDPNIGNLFNIKGIIVVENEEDIIKTINSLTKNDYTSRLEYIADNHKRVLEHMEKGYPGKYKHYAEPLMRELKIIE